MSGTFGAADIEALIQQGNGFAADVLGDTYYAYGPQDPFNPLAFAYVALPVFLTTDDKSASTKANAYGKPLWYGRFDRTQTSVGDYLIGPAGTYFIAAQQALLTTLVIECNAVVSFTRPTGDTEAANAIDINDYGGRSDATDTPLLTGWPASVLIKTRGEASPLLLPGDTKQALFEVLIPANGGVTLRTSDLMTWQWYNMPDQIARGTVAGTEATDLGWRLYVQLDVT